MIRTARRKPRSLRGRRKDRRADHVVATRVGMFKRFMRIARVNHRPVAALLALLLLLAFGWAASVRTAHVELESRPSRETSTIALGSGKVPAWYPAASAREDRHLRSQSGAAQARASLPAIERAHGAAGEAAESRSIGLPADANAAPRPIEEQVRWASEPRDERWSDVVERATLSRLESLGLDTAVVLGIDCRTTLCRLDFDMANIEALQRLAHASEEAGIRSTHQMTTLPSGTPVFAAYLPRDQPSGAGNAN